MRVQINLQAENNERHNIPGQYADTDITFKFFHFTNMQSSQFIFKIARLYPFAAIYNMPFNIFFALFSLIRSFLFDKGLIPNI